MSNKIEFIIKDNETEIITLTPKKQAYCEKNNLRRDINRAVRKFREYCKLRLDK